MPEKTAGSYQQGKAGEIEALQMRHQQLESRLAALDGHVALTASEQTERARLKKEKLAIKDRMQALAVTGAVKHDAC